jgi:hypothetical protein
MSLCPRRPVTAMFSVYNLVGCAGAPYTHSENGCYNPRQVFETTLESADYRTRQTCGFFTPIDFTVYGLGERLSNHRYLADSRVSTPSPPFVFETAKGGFKDSIGSIHHG